ncbi:MAG: hypothetical protein RSC06_15985 [Clostridia bacterium]
MKNDTESEQMYMTELYHGDALRVMDGLPSRSFDAIVTDPPMRQAADVLGLDAVCVEISSAIAQAAAKRLNIPLNIAGGGQLDR